MTNITKNSRKYFVFLMIAVIGFSFGSFIDAKNDSASTPIYIGVSGPLTGNNAQYGAQWKKGFDLALEKINQSGIVKGRKLVYIFEDSQSDPKQSVLIAQKFVADERIIAELGDFSSPASMAATPIYQRAGLVQFGFTNSHPDFTKGGDYTWSNCPTQNDVAPMEANYAKALGFKKVAVFYLNTDWGKITFNLTAKRLEENGIKIVAQESYLPDEKDFKSAITRIKENAPDGIVLISYYTDAALIIQQVHSEGLKQPVLVNSSNHSPKFLELGGNAVEGVYVSSQFTIDDPRPEVKNYVKAYRSKYNEDPDYFSTMAYDTINLIASAIKSGGASREGVKNGLLKLKGAPSVIYGKVTFDRETRRVKNPTDARLVVKGGKFVVWNGKRI
jgi:branched-chain amino acid transport system substrate-binding protein